jgi:hypothetical protein
LPCHGSAQQAPGGGFYPACTDATQRCPQIADRHHEEPRDCFLCHSLGGPGGVVVLVDCMVCHGNQINPDTGLPFSPHHVTEAARVAHCSDCHGNVVQNYDSGIYIPSGPPSAFTPNPRACDACHAPGTESGLQIQSIAATHHATGLGFGIEGTSCLWCHSNAGGGLDMRTCERCHSPLSLHGIVGTGPAGQPGWGHVGTAQDCSGCHSATFTTAAALTPGPTVPYITKVDFEHAPQTGVATIIRITGSEVVNVGAGPDGGEKTYGSIVVLSRSDDAGNIDMSTVRVLESGYMTQTEIYARIPADMASGSWDLRLVKEPLTAQMLMSNKHVVPVHKTVAISAVQATGNTLTVTGTGFGPMPKGFLPTVKKPAKSGDLGVTVDGVACVVTSWSETQVVADCESIASGDVVNLSGVYNMRAPASATVP